MKFQEIDEVKLSIEKKKQRIRLQEQLLKEREKKALHKRYAGLGKLVYEAGLSSLDDDTLKGAFAELTALAKNPEKKALWKEAGASLVSKHNPTESDQIVVSFSKLPSTEIKNRLRDLQFKWNSFRKEFYGYGSAKEIKSLLTNIDCSVEIIND